MKKHYDKLPHLLLFIYVFFFIAMAINPLNRAVWFVEAMTALIPIVVLIVMYVRGTRFSNTAYVLMFVFPMLHTLGAHYTFEKVPFDWFNNLFDFERNMYDRVAHASVGLYAYAIAEYLLTKREVAKKWIAYLFALFTIVTIAGWYEIFEWQYAIKTSLESGIAVLGAQGDIWDAQKDILMDTLGAVVALIILFFTSRNKV